MNLFLLTAVPLAAVALVVFLQRPVPRSVESWSWGAVVALGSLILASFFSGLKRFDGDLWSSFLGLTFTDALLVPGLVVGLWFWWRANDPSELALWLALVFTFAGIRDFLATDRTFDTTDLFLVPLDRVLVLAALPWAARWVRSPGWTGALAVVAVVALVWSLPLVWTLAYAGWAWLGWVVVVGALAGVVVAQKRAAPKDGPVENNPTGEDQPTRP